MNELFEYNLYNINSTKKVYDSKKGCLCSKKETYKSNF